MISEQQFDEVSKQMAAGGFSVKVAGPGAGASPTGDKDMVGGYRGHYEDFPATPQLTGGDIREFASEGERPQVLAEPNVFLGGWPGENPPRQSLDVSTAHPTRPASERYASRLSAAERNQEAIGQIRKGEFVGERPYPYYDPKAPQTGRNPDLFDAAWAAAHGNYAGDSVWKQIKVGE
jgi:hypothetical protein